MRVTKVPNDGTEKWQVALRLVRIASEEIGDPSAYELTYKSDQATGIFAACTGRKPARRPLLSAHLFKYLSKHPASSFTFFSPIFFIIGEKILKKPLGIMIIS
jgi:hypothetical protein